MKWRLYLAASWAIGLIAAASPVIAQTAAADQSVDTPQHDSGIGEIIVTARRREENLLSVPLSMQAISGDQLKNLGVNNLTSLQFTTPGYMPDTNNGFVQVFIRGIGNAIFVGADPSVATFIDDVPQIYGTSLDQLADVERVEILKGAQGGLYGRNATGGVVNIITRRPDTERSKADFRISYGERETVRVSAYVNIPLSQTVALSLSADRSYHDAYVTNIASRQPYAAVNFPTGAFLPVPNGSAPIPVAPGVNVYGYTPQQTAAYFNRSQSPQKINNQDFYALRGKLLIKPTDSLSVTLTGAYAVKDDTSSGQFVSSTPEFNQAALVGLFGSFGVDADLPAGFIPGSGGRKWTTAIGGDPTSYIRDYSVYGNVVWSLPKINITSITAYRNVASTTSGDNATSAVAFIPFNVDFDREYFYQEVRAVSTFDGPLSLLGGATYLDNHLSGRNDVYFLTRDILFGSTQVDQKVRNWSVYAEASFDFTDALSLTASGRYMREKNEANFTLPVISGTKSTQSKFVPAATLRYDFGDGNVYARWARGFKTGGVNILTAPSFYPRPTDGSIFAPETVDTYEAGAKASLLDRRLQLTAAVFYNDYKNLQVDVRARPAFAQVTTAVVNAKSARTYGAEASALWRVADPITLGTTVGYLNAKYKDFSLSNSAVLADFDQSGGQMPKAPEWQVSFTGDLNQPLTRRLNLVGNVLASYTSDVLFKYSALPGVLPNAVGPSYWLINARLGVKTADDRLGLYLVADNVLDRQYFVGADAGTFGNLLNYGQRRIVRGELTFKF